MIKVDVTIQDGLYIATSKEMPGLFVADENLTDLVNEIPEVIIAINKETERKISMTIKNKKYAPLYWSDGKAVSKPDYIDMQINAHKSLIRELLDDVQELRAAVKRIESKQVDAHKSLIRELMDLRAMTIRRTKEVLEG